MTTIWRDDNKGAVFVETMTMLGPQLACDETGEPINLRREMQEAGSHHNLAELMTNVMEKFSKMEYREPVINRPAEHFDQTFEQSSGRKFHTGGVYG